MGRKSSSKRKFCQVSGSTAAQSKAVKRQALHRQLQSKPKNMVVTRESAVTWAFTKDGLPAKRRVSAPILHHMRQYATLLESQEVQPSSHYRHRLQVTGERLVAGAASDGVSPKVMPVYTFLVVPTAFNRKQDRCFPRGKAYRRVRQLERESMMEKQA